MIDSDAFFRDLAQTPLSEFADQFQRALDDKLAGQRHGDLPIWQQALQSLPPLSVSRFELDSDAITLFCDNQPEAAQVEALEQALITLAPWRKGPFNWFGTFVDSEWRSDWKWQRLAPHIQPLEGRTVLDVGCGNGYHCWRMRGAGARFVLGVDPMPKFICQFQALKHYLPQEPVHLLPLACEDMPQTGVFDTVFSMGVLYHRRNPLQHLEELKNALRSKGELVLETLVIDGDANTVLMPQERYAGMRNVWFIPSAKALENWLYRLGFINVRTVDINRTACDEQRPTAWMQNLSLRDFLDSDNTLLTREGYPAPQRAIVIADKK